MATIRIETVENPKNGLIHAEVYIEGVDGPTPRLRSEELFSSHRDAVTQIIEMCRTRFPDHSPFADDPTIGV